MGSYVARIYQEKSGKKETRFLMRNYVAPAFMHFVNI